MSTIDSSALNLVAAQQDALFSAVGYTVAAKQLAAQRQQGQAAVELLETAVQLSREPGKGQQLDSQA